MKTKKCSKCGIEKKFNYFHNDNRSKDGKYSCCKNCINFYQREKYAKDHVRVRNLYGDWGKIVNGTKICSRCNEWKTVNKFNKTSSINCGLWSCCKDCAILRRKIIDRILKMEFVLAYGGCCSCCGEYRLELLTVEHIKNKGHKLIYDTTQLLMYKLKRLGWPEGYTVLCWNCNMSTSNGRPCVHSDKYENYKTKLEGSIENTARNKYFKLKKQLEEMNEKKRGVSLAVHKM